MNKKLLIFCLIILSCFLINSQAFAEDKIISSKQLISEKNSEVILDKVELVEMSDGSYRVRGNAKRRVNYGEEYYRVFVDTKKGTYKTKKLKITKEIGDEVVRTSVKPLRMNPSFKKIVRTQAISTTYPWNVTALLVTEDIPQVPLAKTKVYLNWTKNSNGSVKLGTWGTNFWANPDTYPFHTHWHILYSNNYTPDVYTRSIYKDSTAKYYNWDWLLPSVATYTYHSITVSGYYDGSYSYTFDFSNTGESSSILQIDFYVNGSQIV